LSSAAEIAECLAFDFNTSPRSPFIASLKGASSAQIPKKKKNILLQYLLFYSAYKTTYL
jgi:hypothetical protein